MLYEKGQEDSDPKQEEDGKTSSALRFLDIGVGLQKLAHVICRNFKLTIVSTIALRVYTRKTPPLIFMPLSKYVLTWLIEKFHYHQIIMIVNAKKLTYYRGQRYKPQGETYAK